MTTTAPAVLPSSLLRDLQRVVGDGGLVHDPDRLLVYESDGFPRFRSRPAAVVLPTDTETCARVVELLHGEGVAVVPRGAGTGLSGGAVAPSHAVIVGTSRMSRILEMDPAARRARVQAGVLNARVNVAAARHGLAYAPDPSSESACTLGGNVAENAGGPHCLKYGVTTRYVRALTVVAEGGEILELARPDAPGTLDLTGVFVGSEGCFGLATEIEVALVPRAESVGTLLAAFPRLEDAGVAVSSIIAAGLLPAALEIVDQAAIQAVEASVFAAGYPTDAGAALVVEFDGPARGLDRELARAHELCERAGATEVRRARDEAERTALWQGRKKSFGALGRLAPDILLQDATVPRSRLPEVLRAIGEIGRKHGIRLANVSHAGDGNLHPKLLYDRRDPDETERVERASSEIMAVCVAAGGTITGEHGVGLDKRDYMSLVQGPDELAAMEAVRRAFDPRGLWNPGKVLPDAVGEAGARAGADAPAVDVGERGGGRGSRGGGDGRPGSAGARGAPTPDLLAELGAEAAAWDGEAVARGEAPVDSRWWDHRLREAGSAPPLVLPPSEDGVARVLAEASRRGWSVLPVAGAGEPALDPAVPVDLVLGVAALTPPLEHAPADLTVTAGAGTPWSGLQARVAEAGQWLPVDGAGMDGARLGGVVASPAPRALAAAWGGLRDLLLGLRMVTGDGRVLALGGRVVKNVAGFDLVRLVAGSAGALGVVTGATTRLYPLPPHDVTAVLDLGSDGLETLLEALADVPWLPASVEGGVNAAETRVLVRLAGREAEVARGQELVEHGLAALTGGAVRWVEADEGARLRAELRQSSHTAEGVVRRRVTPRADAVARAVEGFLTGVPEGHRPASVRFFPAEGLVELALASAEGMPEKGPGVPWWAEGASHDGSYPWVVRGPRRLHAAVRELRASRPAPGRAASRRADAIRRAFDPAGILAPGREPGS